jgi:hypothetical protein
VVYSLSNQGENLEVRPFSAVVGALKRVTTNPCSVFLKRYPVVCSQSSVVSWQGEWQLEFNPAPERIIPQDMA